MKLTPEQKEDRKLRRMFEREFKGFKMDFDRYADGDSYMQYATELCYTSYTFGYLKGKRHAH
jgi:hypothetical protein